MDNINDTRMRTGGYMSPSIDVVMIQPEGIVCASGQFEQWQEETLE